MRINFKSIFLIIIILICFFFSFVYLIIVFLILQYTYLWGFDNYGDLLRTFIIALIISIISIIIGIYLSINYKKLIGNHKHSDSGMD